MLRHLPELRHFFSTAPNKRNGNSYLASLSPFLSSAIMDMRADGLCEEIYNLRLNNDFMNFLLTNWQLSEEFLNAVTENASPENKQKIRSSRFRSIYQLNELGRMQLRIEAQQNLVRRAIAARNKRIQEPVVMPVEPAMGTRTELVVRLDDEGKIKIPQELFCPLSGQIFRTPVKVIQDRHTYYFESEFIIQALKLKNENPLTRQPLERKDLLDAPEKKDEVEAYKNEILEHFSQDKKKVKELNIEQASPQQSSNNNQTVSPEINNLVAEVTTQIIAPLETEVARLNTKMNKASANKQWGYQQRINAFNVAITEAKALSEEYKTNPVKEDYKKGITGTLERLKNNPTIIKYQSYEKLLRMLLNVAITLFTGIAPAIIKYATTGKLFFSVEGKSKETANIVLNRARKIK
jgi:uncharacterized membrane-anchored protein YhcB (DUF1043 family)